MRSGMTHNIDSYIRWLHALKMKENKEQILQILYGVGEIMAELVLTVAPKAPKLTGNLWGSINIVVTGKDAKAYDSGESVNGQRVQVEATGMAEFEVRVYVTAPYAERMHEGLMPKGKMIPGPKSEQAGGVGSEFMRKKLPMWEEQAVEYIDLELRRRGLVA